MAITKNDNRQAPTDAFADFTFADFTSGVAELAIAMPSGAVVIGGALIIDTVFNSQTSDTLTVGDAGVVDRYKAGINGTALALTALIPTGYELVSATGGIKIRWTGVGNAPTTGAGRLIVEYVYIERGDFIQR